MSSGSVPTREVQGREVTLATNLMVIFLSTKPLPIHRSRTGFPRRYAAIRVGLPLRRLAPTEFKDHMCSRCVCPLAQLLLNAASDALQNPVLCRRPVSTAWMGSVGRTDQQVESIVRHLGGVGTPGCWPAMSLLQVVREPPGPSVLARLEMLSQCRGVRIHEDGQLYVHDHRQL